MSPKTFLTVGAVLGLAFGIPFLLAPSAMMQIYGIHGTQELAVSYRYFGVALLTFGLVVWPMRGCQDFAMLRPMLIGHAVGDVAGILVSVWAVFSGTINQLAWINVLIYFGLLVGAIFCLVEISTTSPLATAQPSFPD